MKAFQKGRRSIASLRSNCRKFAELSPLVQRVIASDLRVVQNVDIPSTFDVLRILKCKRARVNGTPEPAAFSSIRRIASSLRVEHAWRFGAGLTLHSGAESRSRARVRLRREVLSVVDQFGYLDRV